MVKYEFSSKLWQWDGPSAWHFVSLPKDISSEIKENFGQGGPGWGSIPVTVAINNFSWKTSIFPDKKSGAYLLPFKAEARKKADLSVGDVVKIKLAINP